MPAPRRRARRRGPALERSGLLAPDSVARMIARQMTDPQQRWMLRQPRALRVSFVRDAHGRGDAAEEIWMLRQPDEVRESYIEHVLLRAAEPPAGTPADDPR